MKTRHAWVTITGKVYVAQDEIDAAIEQGYVDYNRESHSPTTDSEAFELIANDKLFAAFGKSDEPMKLCDQEIDISTFS